VKLSAKIPAMLARKYRDKKSKGFYIALFYVGSLETFGFWGTSVITAELVAEIAKHAWRNLPQIVAVLKKQAAQKAKDQNAGVGKNKSGVS